MPKNYIVGKMGFTPLSSDTDMYYQKNKRTNEGYYYELLLVYMDDVLAISHGPHSIMEMIGMRFEIKNNE